MAVVMMPNILDVAGIAALRRAMGWEKKPEAQLRLALQKGLYNLAALEGGRLVGMGRLVGDGAMYWYIQDVIVTPDRQGQGIGRLIVEGLLDFVRENSPPGTSVTVGLFAALGKEGFYHKLGFISRPNEWGDAGMMKRMDIP